MESMGESLTPGQGGSKFHMGLPWLFFALVIGICLPLVFLDDIPQRDVAARYAPMAEAFSSGDFLYAFHPRTGFLHTVFSGILVWLFSCSGFMAAKLSSLIFMALGVFPLYGLARRIYSERVAGFTLLAYLLASQVMRLAYSGLRDSYKVFFILLAAYGLIVIFQERKRLAGYIVLAFAVAGGILARGDLVIFMSLLFFWGIVLEYALKRFPWRSLAACFLILLLCLPAVLLHGWVIGAAVPEMRFALLFEKAFGRFPLYLDILFVFLAGILFSFVLAWGVRKIVVWKHAGKVAAGLLGAVLLATLLRIFSKNFLICPEMPFDFLDSIFKGFFPAIAIFSILGVILRVRRKQWKKEDSILAALLIGHNVLLILQIFFFDKYLYVAIRYLLPAVPLELPWAVLGAMELREFLLRKISAPRARIVWTVIALSVLALVFLADLVRPVIENYTDKRDIANRKVLMQTAKIIRDDYHGSAKSTPKIQLTRYTSNREPRICFVTLSPNTGTYVLDEGKITVAAYLAGGRAVESVLDMEYIVERKTQIQPFHDAFIKLGEVEFQKKTYLIWKWKNKKQ